ncbi:MAG: helix-turn-helix domain-containing protein [Bryobacteraceae bacterium]
MRRNSLSSARRAAGLTQQEAAGRLGVSQAYVALLEGGKRPLSPRMSSRIAKLYRLGPIALPLVASSKTGWDSASLAAALGALGYAGFGYLRARRPSNPAVVLLNAIAANNVEVRVAEALPWLMLEYSDLDWEWLIREAKLRDLQNRLGFLVTLARQLAEKRGSQDIAARLRHVEDIAERARLAREDGLFQPLSEAEREWLRESRSAGARHWNLLTDLDSAPLPYAV